MHAVCIQKPRNGTGVLNFIRRLFGRKQRAGAIPSGVQKSLDWHHSERDIEENESTRTPTGEHVQVQCVWVTELYLPSHHARLLSSIREIGWGDQGESSGESLAQWIAAAGSNISITGWRNLHAITRPQDKDRFFGRIDRLTTELPDAVDYALGNIDHVLPGLIALTMQFVLTDEASNRLERELDDDRQTIVEAKGNGRWSFDSPFQQKQRSARRVDRALHDELHNWFRTTLPGHFSTNQDSRGLPTLELLTLAAATPYERLADAKWFNYIFALDLAPSPSVWESQAYPGLRLSTYHPDGESLTLRLAARESELAPDSDAAEWESYGGRNRAGYCNRLSYLHRTAVILAVASLVTSWETGLANLRNRVAAIRLREESAISELQSVQVDLLSQSRDLVPVTSGILAFAESPARFHWEVDEFKPLSKAPGDDAELFKQLREMIAFRTTRLVNLEREVREAASAQAVLAATGEQRKTNETLIGLSKAVLGLTGLLVILTVILAVLAVAVVLDNGSGSAPAPAESPISDDSADSARDLYPISQPRTARTSPSPSLTVLSDSRYAGSIVRGVAQSG